VIDASGRPPNPLLSPGIAVAPTAPLAPQWELSVAKYYDRPFKDHPVINGIIASAIFVGLVAGILIIVLWFAPGLLPLPK
jgi:hypothetical protein